ASSTPLGTYPVTISGADARTSQTVSATLEVAVPDFTVALTPSAASVRQGSSAVLGVSVGFLARYAGKISLAVSGLPTNASGAFSAISIRAPATPTLTVKAAAATPGGTYTVTVSATSATKVVHKATFALTVIAPDFSVGAAPTSTSTVQGGTVSYPIT